MAERKPKPEPKKHPKLDIYFSESDLQELINGEEFQWTFTTDTGVDIDVLLRPDKPSDYGDDEEDEDEEEDLPEDDDSF